MPEIKKIKRLKKELKLLDVYSIATGATLSSGFFLLPGLIAIQVGPSLILAYLIAAIPLIPALFSMIELATAMPRAGGVYFFLDRTMGPYFGTMGGLGTWLALILKVSFALIGMGAYLILFLPQLEMKYIAVAVAVILGVISIFGTKKSSRLQILLVTVVILFLTILIFGGITQIDISRYSGIFNVDFALLLSTAGTVYVSYAGITKIASLSEEVKDPEKNIPLGLILATATTILIYGLGSIVVVGVIPMSELLGDKTSLATASGKIFGNIGAVTISIIALFAFISVANAGMLSASRYPLAMSRDHLMPRKFRQLSKFGTPAFSIVFTFAIIVLFIITFDPTGIAKLASAFQLFMFSLVCTAVIVMRESRLHSYDPGYKSPLYPWMQIVGIILPFVFIFSMGIIPIVFTVGLIIICSLWYWFYARKRVERTGAIYHIFERLGRQRDENLDTELRGILKEKGLRDQDPFNEIVARSLVLEINEETVFDDVVVKISNQLSKIIPLTPKQIVKQIMEGTLVGATPVTHGVALPHFRTGEVEHSELVLIRAKKGIKVPLFNPLTHEAEEEKIVSAVFCLVSPENNPSQHLRILAQIAGRVDDDNFIKEWNDASDEQQLKEVLLRDERFISLIIDETSKTKKMIGLPLKQISIPKGCLVAMLCRGETVLVPNGNTIFEDGDRLTIIGDPNAIKELHKLYD